MRPPAGSFAAACPPPRATCRHSRANSPTSGSADRLRRRGRACPRVRNHSEADRVSVSVKKTATTTATKIYDTGIGIFKKIMDALGLPDQEYALLELAKGKFTTDPTRHSGQGAFFWLPNGRPILYLLARNPVFSKSGTLVSMTLENHTVRTTKKVFDAFSSTDEDGFTKTIVPVRLSQFGGVTSWAARSV
jgi:hypothetical protein